MNITLQGTNLDLNDTLRGYVDEKMNDAFRAFGDMDLEPVEVAIELEKTTRHHRSGERLYRAEANVSVPGRMLRAEATADDMYQAITQLKHTLMHEIRSWREKLIDEARQGARQATAILEEERAEEATEDRWEAWEEEAWHVEEAEGDVLEYQEKWEDLGEDEWDYV